MSLMNILLMLKCFYCLVHLVGFFLILFYYSIIIDLKESNKYPYLIAYENDLC